MLDAGYYTSEVQINVFRKLDVTPITDREGNRVERVFGQWAVDENNIIRFKPGEKVYLTAEDVKLPNVRTLIETGSLKRTL